MLAIRSLAPLLHSISILNLRGLCCTLFSTGSLKCGYPALQGMALLSHNEGKSQGFFLIVCLVTRVRALRGSGWDSLHPSAHWAMLRGHWAKQGPINTAQPAACRPPHPPTARTQGSGALHTVGCCRSPGDSVQRRGGGGRHWPGSFSVDWAAPWHGPCTHPGREGTHLCLRLPSPQASPRMGSPASEGASGTAWWGGQPCTGRGCTRWGLRSPPGGLSEMTYKRPKSTWKDVQCH